MSVRRISAGFEKLCLEFIQGLTKVRVFELDDANAFRPCLRPRSISRPSAPRFDLIYLGHHSYAAAESSTG